MNVIGKNASPKFGGHHYAKETCSWKGQLEKGEVGKTQVGKFMFKLERA